MCKRDNHMKQLLMMVCVSMIGAGCLSESTTLPDPLEDRFWLLTRAVDSNEADIFQFSPEDVFRYNIRFRSDSFYEINAFCDQRAAAYSLMGDTVTVSPPGISALFDCIDPSGFLSDNDINNSGIHLVLIGLYEEGEFRLTLESDQLVIEALDSSQFFFRECIYDCSFQL